MLGCWRGIASDELVVKLKLYERLGFFLLRTPSLLSPSHVPASSTSTAVPTHLQLELFIGALQEPIVRQAFSLSAILEVCPDETAVLPYYCYRERLLAKGANGRRFYAFNLSVAAKSEE